MFNVPEHIVADPVIVPGWIGMVVIVTATVRASDEHEPIFVFTETFPPAASAVALIEVVVDVPVQPPGNVHV